MIPRRDNFSWKTTTYPPTIAVPGMKWSGTKKSRRITNKRSHCTKMFFLSVAVYDMPVLQKWISKVKNPAIFWPLGYCALVIISKVRGDILTWFFSLPQTSTETGKNTVISGFTWRLVEDFTVWFPNTKSLFRPVAVNTKQELWQTVEYVLVIRSSMVFLTWRFFNLTCFRLWVRFAQCGLKRAQLQSQQKI